MPLSLLCGTIVRATTEHFIEGRGEETDVRFADQRIVAAFDFDHLEPRQHGRLPSEARTDMVINWSDLARSKKCDATCIWCRHMVPQGVKEARGNMPLP